MDHFGIYSEIGKLKKVLLHRPGGELENLTPKWLHELLFDDIPWLERAIEEHDHLKKELELHGIEVVYLTDLVAQSIEPISLKKRFVEQFMNEAHVTHPTTRKRLFDHLISLETKAMISKMMAGISKNDLPAYRNRSLKDHIKDYPFITDPMPNLYFTRDPFSVIFNGVSIHKMYSKTRERETIFADYIFKYHPIYKDTQIFYSRENRYAIEGGDILVLSQDVIAIGISERTEPDAIETIAKTLFKETDVSVILAINLPKQRSFMHLDTVLTQVDVDKFLIHHDFLGKLDVYEIYPGSKKGTLRMYEKSYSIKRLFSYHLKRKITLIPCGGNDEVASDREQWNDGANALAIAPGVVVVYERNQITNRLLIKNGIKTIQIPSSELSRGRGGPRCMSMPLMREAVIEI
ncbi:MAG: arginine deiminase [Acholeplasmataceae bacterium]|nr:arginine deiminase [Acholeplasmataceae bacterium]